MVKKMIFNIKLIFIFVIIPFLFSLYGLFIKNYNIFSNSLYSLLLISVLLFFYKKFPIFKKTSLYSIIIFILLSVFAGKALRFYFIVPHWDKILHFISGFIIASVARELFEKNENVIKSRNSFFKIFFIFIFCVAMAGLWELFEFSSDNILKTNAQNNSLSDSMCDMIAGSVSALLYILYKFFIHL